jgi:hypothetical protein
MVYANPVYNGNTMLIDSRNTNGGTMASVVVIFSGDIGSLPVIESTLACMTDTWIDSGNPSANYGGANSLQVSIAGAGQRSTFVKFAVPQGLPPNAVLSYAKLQLKVQSTSGGSNSAVQLYVYQTDASWDAFALTWNNAGTYPRITADLGQVIYPLNAQSKANDDVSIYLDASKMIVNSNTVNISLRIDANAASSFYFDALTTVAPKFPATLSVMFTFPSPTPSPTPQPTPSPTPVPTPQPTPKSTPQPKSEPTPSPTPQSTSPSSTPSVTTTDSSPPTTPALAIGSSSSSSSSVVGAVIGVLLTLCCILMAVFVALFIMRRRKQQRNHPARANEMELTAGEKGGAYGSVSDVMKKPDNQYAPYVSNSTPTARTDNHYAPAPVPVSQSEALFSFLVSFSSIKLGNELGKGAFGVVYKATLLNGETIACKMLSPETSQAMKEEEFMQEARVMSQLPRHPNVIRMVGFCRDEKICILSG